MKRRILASRIDGRIAIVLLEDEEPVGFMTEGGGEADEPANGQVYLARRINRVGGMDASFVDLGGDKRGLLKDEDVLPAFLRKDLIPVQVTRIAQGRKMPQVTTKIALPGRTLVLHPFEEIALISSKVRASDTRETMLSQARSLREALRCGLILRTAAEGAGSGEILKEGKRILERWQLMLRRIEYSAGPGLISQRDTLIRKAVRDMHPDTVSIETDLDELFDQFREALAEYAPEAAGRLIRRSGSLPLFDLEKINSSLKRLLGRTVGLRHGGNLVIDRTEAFTVIDVNAAVAVKSGGMRETILRTDLDAVSEVARQLRLRSIGGVILVDLIDPEDSSDLAVIEQAFREKLLNDPVPAKLIDITPLCIAEITRARRDRTRDEGFIGSATAAGRST